MRTLRLVGAMAICALTVTSLAGCGNDNEDEPSYPIVNVEGSRISAINDFKISYDDRGRVDMIVNTSTREQMTVDYGKNRITIKGVESDGEGQTLNFDYNHKGYIKSISAVWDYYDADDDEHVKGSGRTQYSYDDKGHLITVLTASGGTETNFSTGVSTAMRVDVDSHLKWSGSNLVSVEIDGTETADGRTQTIKDATTVEYGMQANSSLQLPMSLADIYMANFFIDDDFIEIMAAVGLFGIGPKELPTRISERETDGDTDTYTLSYTLNADGTIAEESANGQPAYRYVYTLYTK